MKRASIFISTLCVIFIAIILAGCGSNDGEKLLIKTGLESADRMKEAICSESYRNTISRALGVNEPDDMVNIVTNENVGRYKAIYEVSFNPEEALVLLNYQLEDYEKLSEYLQEKLKSQVYGSIPSLINSKSGWPESAFVALFNDSGSIKYNTLQEKRVLVFIFESGYPIWVTFSSDGNGIASYISHWIIADCAQINSEEDLISHLCLDIIPTLEVRRIVE